MLHTLNDNKKTIGTEGETLAAQFLEQNGYAVLHKNWRSQCGEIDIIALKEQILVFAEVKTWACADFDTLSFALGKEKQKRMIKTSKRFLLEYRQYSNSYIRFDVLLLNMFENERIYHIENAFSEFL